MFWDFLGGRRPLSPELLDFGILARLKLQLVGRFQFATYPDKSDSNLQFTWTVQILILILSEYTDMNEEQNPEKVRGIQGPGNPNPCG